MSRQNGKIVGWQYRLIGQRRWHAVSGKNDLAYIRKRTDKFVLRALYLEPPTAKWQSMKTAPIDGTWILLRGRTIVGEAMIPVVVAWSPPGSGATGQGWRDSGSFKSCDGLAFTDGAEWMPIPE